MKKTVSMLLLLVFIFCASSCGGDGNVKSLVFSRPGDVALEVGQSDYGGYLLVSVRKKSDFSPEQVEFVSENPEVATIEYKNVALTTYLYYEIVGVGAGETFVYAQSVESGVASEKIKVTVTAPDSPLPADQTPAQTDKEAASPTEKTPSQTEETPSNTVDTPTPSETPTAETPTETEETPTPGEQVLHLVHLDDNVARGSKMTLTAQGLPNESYKIKVYYSASVSKASGLEDKTADKDGNVSWTWRVGASTKSGEHKIVIEGGGESLTLYFTTTE